MHVRSISNEESPVGALRFAARATIVFVAVLTMSVTLLNQFAAPTDLDGGPAAASASEDAAPQPIAMPLTF